MTARFTPDHRGVGEMLRAPFMQAEMIRRAEIIKARAEAIAPVDEKGPHPGRYKASFHTKVTSHGGAPGRYGELRAEAIVYNDSPEAIYVEFASWGAEPYRTLARAAFQEI
jgi:hypothetical protein